MIFSSVKRFALHCYELWTIILMGYIHLGQTIASQCCTFVVQNNLTYHGIYRESCLLTNFRSNIEASKFCCESFCDAILHFKNETRMVCNVSENAIQSDTILRYDISQIWLLTGHGELNFIITVPGMWKISTVSHN